jgi:pilus assembly protein CpaB
VDRTTKLLLGAGIVLALVVGLGIYAAVTAAQELGRATSAVVLARGEVPERTQFTAGNVRELLTTQQVPRDLVPQGALSDPAEAVGKVTTARLVPGEIVIGSPDRLATGDGASGRPAASIPRDKVALAMAATEAVSVAGAVQSGDRVDVIATLSLQSGQTITQAIFQDVRVFSVGRWQPDPRQRNTNTAPSSVTLLLDHQQALVLENLLQTGARVSLALRRLDQSGEVPTDPVTPDAIVRRWLDPDGVLTPR